MSSTISALTSGGGIAMTGDSSGNLSLRSGATSIVDVTATGATVTGTLAVSGGVTLTTTLPVLQGGTGVTTSTGTGAVVLSTSPTLVTPLLGTPTSGNLANCTGIPAPAALSTASGSAPSYSARAWVNFNGTGTPAIRASGNVSSITDNGVGNYTVNFTTAMVDADYASTVTSNNVSASDSRTQNVFSQVAASLVVYIRNAVGAGIDVTLITVTVTR